jgi:hypothetical protein
LDNSQDSGSNSAQASNIPDWLSGIDTPQASTSQPAQPDNVPDWLSESDALKASAPESAQEGNVPDWLSGIDTPQATTSQPAQPGNIPDWLSGLDTPQTSAPEPAQEGNVPGWLSGRDSPQTPVSEPVQEANLPDWLSGLDTPQDSTPEPVQTDNLPNWLNDAESKNQEPIQSIPSVDSLGSTAQEQDDAVAWLESLAAKHGAKPEEMVTDPSKRFDTPPEWVSQAQSIGEAQPSSALEGEKSNVENALNIGEQYFADFENISAAAPATDETSVWLRNLDEEEKHAQPSSASNDIPEWMSDSQQSQNSIGQVEFAEQESGTQKADLPNWLSGVEKDAAPQNTFTNQDLPENDLSDWLSGLDDEPGLPFDAVSTPDSILFASKLGEPPAKPQEPITTKPDLPGWLSNVDSQNAEPAEEWKNSVQEEPVIPSPKQTRILDDSQIENPPAWLSDIEKETSKVDDDDTPPWLHREKWEAEEAHTPMPTSPSDWHPEELPQPAVPMQNQESPVDEIRKPFAPQDFPPPQPTIFSQVIPAAQSSIQPEAPAKKKKPGTPARKPQPEAQSAVDALNQAKSELDRGDIPAALAHYGKLIKKGKHLEETISDLTESIYRYPVEVGIWQTLGDAYMRANRLREALEAYNKAEELIR